MRACRQLSQPTTTAWVYRNCTSKVNRTFYGSYHGGVIASSMRHAVVRVAWLNPSFAECQKQKPEKPRPQPAWKAEQNLRRRAQRHDAPRLPSRAPHDIHGRHHDFMNSSSDAAPRGPFPRPPCGPQMSNRCPTRQEGPRYRDRGNGSLARSPMARHWNV